jgi:hypothetical protein
MTRSLPHQERNSGRGCGGTAALLFCGLQVSFTILGFTTMINPCALAALVTLAASAAAQTVLIPWAALWRYSDTAPFTGVGWTASGFSDADWSLGVWRVERFTTACCDGGWVGRGPSPPLPPATSLAPPLSRHPAHFKHETP